MHRALPARTPRRRAGGAAALGRHRLGRRGRHRALAGSPDASGHDRALRAAAGARSTRCCSARCCARSICASSARQGTRARAEKLAASADEILARYEQAVRDVRVEAEQARRAELAEARSETSARTAAGARRRRAADRARARRDRQRARRGPHAAARRGRAARARGRLAGAGPGGLVIGRLRSHGAHDGGAAAGRASGCGRGRWARRRPARPALLGAQPRAAAGRARLLHAQADRSTSSRTAGSGSRTSSRSAEKQGTDAEARYAKWQRRLMDLESELAGIRETARAAGRRRARAASSPTPRPGPSGSAATRSKPSTRSCAARAPSCARRPPISRSSWRPRPCAAR